MRFSPSITPFQRLLVFIVFLVCLFGACMINPVFCPDEAARQLLTNYIFQNNKLPTGNELETIIPGWGFSYALRPYLPSIIASFLMRLWSLIYTSEYSLLVVSRMCSVFSLTGCCYLCIKSGNMLFRHKETATLFAVILCFTPQVSFLGMYQCNDSFALFSICLMFYSLIRGSRLHWDIKSSLLLALSFSVCVLSYYSAYMWIPTSVIFCIGVCFRDQSIDNKISFVARRSILIGGVVFLLTGWFFVRNAILHDGDFLGISTERKMRDIALSQGSSLYDFVNSHEQGISFPQFFSSKNFEWLRMTTRSTIGVFGYMDIYLSTAQYTRYYFCIFLAMILFIFLRFVNRKDTESKYMTLYLLLSSISTIGLSLYQSYFRDYQPQGRYIISLVLFVAYAFSYVFDNLTVTVEHSRSMRASPISFPLHAFTITIWLILFILSWYEAIIHMTP